MAGLRGEGIGGKALDENAAVQHGDAIGRAENAGKVVREMDAGEAHLCAERVEQSEDGVLQIAIKAREGFIEEEQRRAEDERACNGDALALSAAELRRTVREKSGWKRNGIEDGADASMDTARCVVRRGARRVNAQRLGKNVGDGEAGIERAYGVLEDELDAGTRGAGARGVEALAVEEGVAGEVRFEAGDAASQRGFAGTRSANDGETFAGSDAELNVAEDGRDARGARPESMLHIREAETAHLKDRSGGHGRRGEPCSAGCRVRLVFDERAGTQDEDTIGDGGEQARIVADDEHGKVPLRAKLLEQIEHAALREGVERGGRLVCEQERRLLGERLCDGYALCFSAAELMRKGCGNALGIGEAGCAEGCEDCAAASVGRKHVAKLRFDAAIRAEAAEWILKDEADTAAAQGAALRRGDVEQIAILQAKSGAAEARGRRRHAEDTAQQ